MISICYDHEIFSIQQYGGASRYFAEVIKRLAQDKELQISLFLGLTINEYRLEEHSESFHKFSGFKYKEIPKTKMVLNKINNYLFPGFLKKSKSAIYHQTYYGSFVNSHKGKHIVTVLDMTHELFPDKFSRIDDTAVNKKKAVERADGIVCISESTKKDLMRIYNVKEEKIRVIYLASSLNKQINTERSIKNKYILYVGGRKTYKNFLLLLNTYARRKELHSNYDLVCAGGGAFSQEESKIINSHNLQDKIHLTGGSDEKLSELYKNAEVLVYPSKYEGFGIPPLEAMTMGCPVITTNISSIPEVTGDAALYIDPDSESDLKNALNKILSSVSLRDELVKKGMDQQSKFSWDKCADEHKKFYLKVLNA